MTIGIINPYFDTLGGGEKYCLTLASHWSKHHDVVVLWDDKTMLQRAEERYGLDLTKVQRKPNIFLKGNIIPKIQESMLYNVLFFLSDGSIPTTLANKNILHFQRPFINVHGKSIINQLKLARYNTVIVNSEFTKEYVDREYGVKSHVIYPPVDTENFSPQKKEKIILSVGRFSASLRNNKKQREMIDIFKEHKSDVPGVRLVLVGGLMDQDIAYYETLKKKVKDDPDIILLTNISLQELIDWYGKASVYWHAAGYGEDESLYPASYEHFGISTVEAMASGCVPVVIDGGGQREIVNHNQSGLLWRTKKQLISYTKKVFSDKKFYKKLQKGAINRAEVFTRKRFVGAYDAVLSSL